MRSRHPFLGVLWQVGPEFSRINLALLLLPPTLGSWLCHLILASLTSIFLTAAKAIFVQHKVRAYQSPA